MEIEQVYREVAPKLQSYLTGNGCSYATACDIVQETFLRLWKRRDELSDDLHQVSGLAFTIARNYRNDLARKAQHEVLSARDEECGEEEPEVAGEGPQEEARPGEAGDGLVADGIAALEWMAAADGDYSQIERDCVAALAKNK